MDHISYFLIPLICNVAAHASCCGNNTIINKQSATTKNLKTIICTVLESRLCR